MHINEFSIGMGPAIFSRTSKKTAIKNSLRILPIGGYVAMVGEDEDVKDDSRALCNKPVWQRMIITAAGSVMNLLLGVILTFAMTLSSSAIGNTTVAGFTDGASSQSYGLRVGDEITKIGSHSVRTMNEVAYDIMHDATKPVDITVLRGGEKTVLKGVVFGEETEDGVAYGIMDFKVAAVSKTVSNITRHTFRNSVLSIRMIWESLYDFVTGKYSVDAVSGPIGITSTITNVAKEGAVNLIYLTSVLAMNLGIFNLLPIPALDGGRLFFQLIELIFRRPINRKVEGYIHTAGLMIFFALIILITFKDISKLL